jgi:hypothetical protein
MNEELLSVVVELIPPLLHQTVDFFAMLVDEELEEEEVMERVPRVPRRDGFLRDKLTLSPEAFKETFRMSPHTFIKLANLVAYVHHPSSSVSGDVALASAVNFLAHSGKFRQTRDMYGIGHSYLHTEIHSALDSLIDVLSASVSLPQDLEQAKVMWMKDPKFLSLKGCIGAVDGTHIKYINPEGTSERWRCRKGFFSTNTMIVCDANMRIMKCVAGFEGSAHDQRVLSFSNFLNELPGDCFLLADAGYSMVPDRVLVPYRNCRYHLSEFGGRGRPNTKEELFNLRHSSLRTTVERCIGRLKGKWRILSTGVCANPANMQRIIYSCVCLHNFLLNEADVFYLQPHEDLPDDIEVENPVVGIPWASRHAWRECIANEMWEGYDH